MSLQPPFRLEHLDRLSDSRGLFEHAEGILRRREHGYCSDDNARLALVTLDEPDTGIAKRLNRLSLQFLFDAQMPDGTFRNRMDVGGIWEDEPSINDCWGRCIWAMGTTASRHPDAQIRSEALKSFLRGAPYRAPHSRAMAFAALGAANLLETDPTNDSAVSIAHDFLESVQENHSGAWTWPELRLTYANASLAEAVIAAGHAIDDRKHVDQGLSMLSWLLDLETGAGHLSVTGHHGRGPADHGLQFDQQPIEVAAMADACWRAYRVTNDSGWLTGVTAAAEWFLGKNDAGLVMFDTESGGGYDGLHRFSVNQNEGAESTLALLSTMQRAHMFAESL